MKIHLYNQQYSRVYNISTELLSTMNYDVQCPDKMFGIIRAYKSSNLTRIFDLKLIYENDTISISLFPGLLSSDFESISYDEITAGIFVEALLNYLNYKELNSFRLGEEDYLEALAY